MTECGSRVGFGHITRCASIGQVFEKVGYRTELLFDDKDLRTLGLPIKSKQTNWYDPSNELLTEIENAYAIIVDSYIATEQQHARIAQLNSNIAIIDDWIRRPYDRGIVIDWTIGAEKYAYLNKSPEVLYLLGCEYCSVRPEFNVPSKRTFASLPHSILVTFGGSDIRDLTVPILSLLQREFPDLHKHVIVGAGVQDHSFVDIMNDTHTTFHVDCDAVQIRDLMSNNDLAICAGGQTLYELASQGLPPLVIFVAENQKDDIREFSSIGFASYVGEWSDPEVLSKLSGCIKALMSPDARRSHSIAGRRYVDGQGTRRLVETLIKHWDTMLLAN